VSLTLQHRDLPGGVRWIAAAGELDAETAPQLDELITATRRAGCHRIAVDLERVSYIASAGVGVFVGHIQACRDEGGDLVIVYAVPEPEEGQGIVPGFNPLEVFHLLGLGEIMTVAEDEAEALQKLAGA